MKLRHVSRRAFLKASALAAGTISLTPQILAAANVPVGRFDPFEPVPLGKSGLKFSRMIMGTGVNGGIASPITPAWAARNAKA